MCIEERRGVPQRSSLENELLRETVEDELNTNVLELAARLGVYYSIISRHLAQIDKSRKLPTLIPHELTETERKEVPHALTCCCGKRKELSWTEPLCAMKNGVSTIELCGWISAHHQHPSLNRVFTPGRCCCLYGGGGPGEPSARSS
ncbi:hypothetical protein M514_06522 [Trichuris suis]|uniref:Uncharacterized protein n=1 Tax=Trichuris suis TaxID=68888 RepID=A0A085N2X4_9BILA|nr:hypothetical protein M513_06522 [Trichuris suis]KFD63820.1 hypothetical protein M514_06522 [Trichuris suis]